MPAPVRDIIATPTTSQVQISLEPASNAFHSLVMLARHKKLSGLVDWITKTNAAMSKEERRRNELVVIGVYYAAIPDESYPSFPAYLEHLETLPPPVFREKLMDEYSAMTCYEDPDAIMIDQNQALRSVENYLEFLRQRFGADVVDEEMESVAYSYVMDPPRLKELIISHLRHMWDTYLEEEWERIAPMLRDAVAAFEQVDYDGMSRIEIVEYITGRKVDHEHWRTMIEEAEQIVFSPSAHVGPYMGKFSWGGTQGIFFQARLPEGTEYYAPDLSRAEILILLNALADDTRLRILELLGQKGEMGTPDIKAQLELSQSAASRHLEHLTATGYLITRRHQGTNLYQLNPDRIDHTFRALKEFCQLG